MVRRCNDDVESERVVVAALRMKGQPYKSSFRTANRLPPPPISARARACSLTPCRLSSWWRARSRYRRSSIDEPPGSHDLTLGAARDGRGHPAEAPRWEGLLSAKALGSPI